MAFDLPVQNSSSPTLGAEVAARLREEILSEAFPPGSALPEHIIRNGERLMMKVIEDTE